MSGALRQLMRRQRDARALVSLIAESIGSPVAVEDIDGQLLHGEAPSGASTRFPITQAGTRVGWVAGGADASLVAALLDHLVAGDAEKKALGAEVLHLYREVNLIYSFSEKLAALLDLDAVARLTLREARQMIVATDGVLMLLDEATGALQTVAGFGDELPNLSGFRHGVGIVGAVAASGVAEIVNDVDADRRRITEDPAVKALICCSAQSRRACHRRDRDRQHDADGLHRCRIEAADHAGAPGSDGDRECPLVRAHGAGGARARAADGAAPGRRSGAREARKRAHAGRADPGRSVPGGVAGGTWIRAGGQESPGTAVWRRLLRRAHAARGATIGLPCVSRMSRARACRRPWS